MIRLLLLRTLGEKQINNKKYQLLVQEIFIIKFINKYMNAKFDTLCRYYNKGNCRKGDQCEYQHDTQNIEKVNLVRDEKGKLDIKRNNDFQYERGNTRGRDRGRGRGRGTYERQQDDEKGRENEKIVKNQEIDQQQQKNQYEQSEQKGFGQNQEGNKDRQIKQKQNGNVNQQEGYNQQGEQRERNNVNSKRWERHYNNDYEDNQNQFNQNKHRKNTFIVQNKEKEMVKQNRQLNEGLSDVVNVVKKVKKNEMQEKKRNQVLNLEQQINVDKLIQIVGYNFQFLGILTTNTIDFYQIPFKRNGVQILDDENKKRISYQDKQLISASIQQHQNDEYSLVIQFTYLKKDQECYKNLLIYNNVFNQQVAQLILDISIKEIAYTDLENRQLCTFCKDGLIRIFQQNDMGQFKYTQHYNVEQSIESVIKVGSNYLIGVISGELFIFDGIVISQIAYKFSKKCTQMIVDFNRVILKMDDDDDNKTSIYVLNQKLEIIGPIYDGEQVKCLELIRSYENDKLFIFGLCNSIEIYIEIENKLHLINVIKNQKFTQMKKIEITNENMVTQKFIAGQQNGELKIFSVVPEQ
ncbi:unnamed protein product [Paramecium sonneborni]|uniref:C3H1-type domain-containing protein n=1 Tax=Paramecium sonneborni TaxID=65129 RepID=A0A8S1R6A8_9CILI|nr:unnamed protein product [Paramecium sonneborni]